MYYFNNKIDNTGMVDNLLSHLLHQHPIALHTGNCNSIVHTSQEWKPMKSWIKKVFGFGAASLLSDVSHEMTITLIPTLVALLVGDADAPLFIGIIASITEAVASFLRICSGILSDSLHKKKPLIIAGYGISTLFITLIGFTHSIYSLTACRLAAYMGAGLREPPRDALIAAVIAPPYYGRAFGLRNAMDTAGSLIGPLLTLFCIPYLSVQNIFLVSAIPGIAALAAIAWWVNDTPDQQMGKVRETSSLLINLSALPRPFIYFVGIMFIFDCATINKLLIMTRARELLTLNGTTNPTRSIIILYTLFNATRALSELMIGWMIDYLPSMLIFAFLGCGFLTIASMLAQSSDVAMISCAFLFISASISTAAAATIKKASVATLVPPAMHGLGYGIQQATEGIALLIASSSIGSLWTWYGPTIGFGYTIGMSLVAGILSLTLHLKSYN